LREGIYIYISNFSICLINGNHFTTWELNTTQRTCLIKPPISHVQERCPHHRKTSKSQHIILPSSAISEHLIQPTQQPRNLTINSLQPIIQTTLRILLLLPARPTRRRGRADTTLRMRPLEEALVAVSRVLRFRGTIDLGVNFRGGELWLLAGSGGVGVIAVSRRRRGRCCGRGRRWGWRSAVGGELLLEVGG
jgi:hypothetical protein